jgi:SAM-dependent methyltransferase
VGLFKDLASRLVSPVVLEVGTKRADPKVSTHRADWFPNARQHVMVDIELGLDVDVAGDLHRLPFGSESFDVFMAPSIFEHVKRPWVCSAEIARVLRPGGIAYVQSHQSFPIHGYPSDYWRFTDGALRLLFEDAGLVTLDAGYEFPCSVVPGSTFRDEWNFSAEAFLNVDIVGRRV